MALSLAIGLVGLLLIRTFGRSLIGAIAPDAQVADLAGRYLAVFSLVVLGEAVGQCLSSCFNGCGQTKIPLVSFSLSLPLNVLASVALIHSHFGRPALGVTGAALGSALAIGAQVALLAAQLVLRHGHLRREAGRHKGTFSRTFRRHVATSPSRCPSGPLVSASRSPAMPVR